MDLDLSLLRQYWHLVCHRSEVARRGDYIRLDTAAGEIVAFHDGSKVQAFDNRCPHRGARIFSAAFGNAPATCPYHGWTYRSGQMFVADRGRFAGCDLSGATIKHLQTAWVGDFLFVGLEPRQTVEDQLSGLYELVEAISRNISKRADFSNYSYECYWPIAVENALEPYHISAIHPKTLNLLKISDGKNEFFGKNSLWRAEVNDERSAKILRSLKRFFDIDLQFEGYQFIYLYPFGMISSTFGYSYSVQNFFPKGGGETAFYSRLLQARTRDDQAARTLESFFESSANINRQVFSEDHAVCKLVPADSWTSDPLRFAADSEVKIQHFRESCRTHLAECSDLAVPRD